jgi:serine/threonine-protein kinase
MNPQLEVHELVDRGVPRPGDVVAGKYRIDASIARGGMGAVLAATHQVTGRRLALKWLLHDPGNDAEASLRLVREAQAAARVRHPNVVDVYDIGEHDGALFLVMELLEGDTLAALLQQRTALEPRAMLELLLPAMRGVEAAHRNHVLHRDLKPSNIFLCRAPDSAQLTPRVLDFGISKILASAGDGEDSLTRTGAVLGTPQYMAKEQLTSDAVDERADVYALGVIMYQCLTGRLPFQDANYNALVLKIATATPAPIAQLAAGIPPGLQAVVMRAMAREPDARFADVAALIEALRPFQGESPGTQPAAQARRAWPWLLALGLLAVLAAWAAWQSLSVAPAATAPRQLNGPALEARPTRVPADPPIAGPSASAPSAGSQPPIAPPQDAPAASRQRTLDKRRTRARANVSAAPAAAPSSDVERTPPEPPVPVTPDQF